MVASGVIINNSQKISFQAQIFNLFLLKIATKNIWQDLDKNHEFWM